MAVRKSAGFLAEQPGRSTRMHEQRRPQIPLGVPSHGYRAPDFFVWDSAIPELRTGDQERQLGQSEKGWQVAIQAAKTREARPGRGH
jgi:hypothetical protein